MQDCYHKALALLSARPYSRFSLIQKIKPFAVSDDELNHVVERLVDLGYLNDESYAQSLTRYSISRGEGPNRLIMRFKAKGIADILAKACLDSVDWEKKTHQALVEFFLSHNWSSYLQKKTRLTKSHQKTPNKTFLIRQKAIQYLVSRGFLFEHIQFAWHSAWQEYRDQLNIDWDQDK
jgi:regulatory protein